MCNTKIILKSEDDETVIDDVKSICFKKNSILLEFLFSSEQELVGYAPAEFDLIKGVMIFKKI